MTPKQKLFVKEYLVDLNATRAAKSAGYSEKTAYSIGQRLLKHVEIKAALQQAAERKAQKLDISTDYVLSTVQDTVERCRQVRAVVDKRGQPIVVETPAGEIVPAYVFNALGVLKGCELLGKYLKIFSDRVENTHSGEVVCKVIHIGN